MTIARAMRRAAGNVGAGFTDIELALHILPENTDNAGDGGVVNSLIDPDRSITLPRYDFTRKATYNTNALNGYPVISFNDRADECYVGDDTNYIFADNTKTGISITAVARPQNGTTNGIGFVYDFGRAASSGYGLVIDDNSAGGYSSGGANFPTVSIADQWVIVSIEIDFSTSLNRAYLNNALLGEVAWDYSQLTATEINESSTRQTLNGPVTVGGQSKTEFDSDRFFYGDLAELIVRRDISQRTDDYNYLKAKYGL